MTEADIFGVQSPETGDLGFVSVMGMLGEHYAGSLYLGSEGIHGFLNLQAMGPFAGPDDLIQIPNSRRRSPLRGDLALVPFVSERANKRRREHAQRSRSRGRTRA